MSGPDRIYKVGLNIYDCTFLDSRLTYKQVFKREIVSTSSNFLKYVSGHFFDPLGSPHRGRAPKILSGIDEFRRAADLDAH